MISKPNPKKASGAWRKLQSGMAAVILVLSIAAPSAFAQQTGTSILPTASLASKHFGNDGPWYMANVPFFDCSDATIAQVFYYRWALYKSHLKDLGNQGVISTEFLNDVSWAIYPFQSLNDATAYHIHEGRWVRNARYTSDYINYMYADGGNDRHFSESIADAVYANFLARGDLEFSVQYLPAMKKVYEAWGDHYDSSKGLYWIMPLLDATEYTIASIDASNGTDGFSGGAAFRPSINSFMYANAQAISKLAALSGDPATAQTYATRAADIKARVQSSLWNSDFQHFTDRFYVTNSSATVASVAYWNFIRGRELVGYTPWYFGLPDDNAEYALSWDHILSPAKLGGPYGLRTTEPSYQYYMRQYRYEGSSPECQWNGPSWPFQTTLVLGGMANLLNDYSQRGSVTEDIYVGLLRQYAQQHFVNGTLDLQENYNPDNGNIIVGLARSHHYNHSSYPDLVITGLAGLRPRADNTLEVNPLIPTNPASVNPITYFCLENVAYHGHLVTIVYDKDGTRYNVGAGLSVYVDGIQVVAPSALGKKTVPIAAPVISTPDPSVDLAINFTQRTYPAPSASVNSTSAALFPALDGRVWYWPGVANYWSNSGSTNASDWYAVNFGASKNFTSVALNFYGDSAVFAAPTSYDLQYWAGDGWVSVPNQQKHPATPLANGENTVTFSPLATSQLRVVVTNPLPRAVALVEFKAFGDPTGVMYVDLRATDATAGSDSWANRGTLGAFSRVGGPTLVANVANTGIPGVQFNGSTDAYQGPATNVDLDGSSDRTVEVWAFNPALVWEETLVSWGYRGSTRQNMAFNFGSDSRWGSATHYSDDVGWGGTAPAPNSWHHLVYTYSSRGVRIYVDGKIRASKTLSAELNTYPNQPINLGCQRESAMGARTQLYSGFVNAVRIYGGALTPAQVAARWAAGPLVLPAIPSSVTVQRTSDTSASLTWSPVAGVTSYKVSRSADGGQTWAEIGASSTADYVDNTVNVGTAYWYRVQASNGAGDSSASAAVTVVAGAYDQWKIDTGLGANADDNADPDSDGQGNRAEYIAGTNPSSSADALKIASIIPAASEVTVTVNGKAKRTYVLQRKASLNGPAGWADIASQTLGSSDGIVTLTDPAPLAKAGFYRVVVLSP